MKRVIAIALLVVVVTAAVKLTATVAQDTQPLKTPPEFAGKIVILYTRGNPINAYTLENVELKQVAGKAMLIGTGVDSDEEDNWTADIPSGVAWESVDAYYALTKEQYKRSGEIKKLHPDARLTTGYAAPKRLLDHG